VGGWSGPRPIFGRGAGEVGHAIINTSAEPRRTRRAASSCWASDNEAQRPSLQEAGAEADDTHAVRRSSSASDRRFVNLDAVPRTTGIEILAGPGDQDPVAANSSPCARCHAEGNIAGRAVDATATSTDEEQYRGRSPWLQIS